MFLFQCSVDHRDLHSFPTRRSSDLEISAKVIVAGQSVMNVPGDGRLILSGGLQINNGAPLLMTGDGDLALSGPQDRKSTRLNSSHANISYAVFCLKKKKKTKNITT